MSPLQWALLVFGALTIIAVYLYSRRDRRAMEQWEPSEKDSALVPPADQQLDIFDAGKFDEYGVGKPRRVAPSLDPVPGEEGDGEALEDEPAPAAAVPPPAPGSAKPGPAPRVAPTVAARPGLAPVAGAPAAAPAPAPAKAEKLLSLLIAERDGHHIEGVSIHQALEACELEFGARQIYHRVHEGRPVFSVASLLKPGLLVPEQAEEFSTPGLAMFMVLPGPKAAPDAIRDMLLTAQRLAKMLNAEVYDAKRKLLSEPAARALQAEVENWARLNLST